MLKPNPRAPWGLDSHHFRSFLPARQIRKADQSLSRTLALDDLRSVYEAARIFGDNDPQKWIAPYLESELHRPFRAISDSLGVRESLRTLTASTDFRVPLGEMVKQSANLRESIRALGENAALYQSMAESVRNRSNTHSDHS